MARAYTITRESAYIGERVCDLIVHESAFGIETLLFTDSDSGELIAAEQIDGEWVDIGLDYAEREFADILAAARAEK